MGRVVGAHGIRGWLKIFSDADPREALLGYSPWWLHRDQEWVPFELIDGAIHGKGLIAKLKDIDDRTQAESLYGLEIAVKRDQLEPLEEGEYYWADLLGLEVSTIDGVGLGVVEKIFETGANDVLIVRGEKEHLIPYVRSDVIKEIDLAERRMLVDWDPDF